MTCAEKFLLGIFTDPVMRNPIPLSVIQTAAKRSYILKSDLRKARKKLGIDSQDEGGVRVWFYPKEPRR